jgi:hypothetical protein
MQTPINLLFTRRLANPSVGAKLTGKVGNWTVAALVADDEAPGQRVAANDVRSGARAWTSVARVSRKLSAQSSIGSFVTHRTFAGRENTVVALDGRVRFGRVWSVEGQLAHSRLAPDLARDASTGEAYFGSLSRNARTVSMKTAFEGRSNDFAADLGFIPRLDVHSVTQTISYISRPATVLSNWGPTVLLERTWTFDGRPREWRARPSLEFSFQRSTDLTAFWESSQVTLRPGDAPNVTDPIDSRPDTWGVTFSTSPQPAWSASSNLTFGRAINFTPAEGLVPEVGDHFMSRLTFGLRPVRQLRIDNTWLHTSLRLQTVRAFTTQIARTRWAWQFTREWSLRLIAQYDVTRGDAALTTTATRRSANVDVLVTKLINPWTALYVGYNGNAQNAELIETGGLRALQRSSGLTVDGWQVFVKWSHLLRW